MSAPQAANIGLGHTILRRALLTPDARALTFEGQTLTCAELGDRVKRLTTVLRDGGVSKGDRVGYIGLNHPTFLELLYACGCLGAVFVPLNFRLTGPEVRFIANDADITVMFADDMLRPLIDSEKATLNCTRYLTVESAADGWDSLESLMAEAKPADGIEKVEADDIAFIM
jgi:fatty-acyl-CoA synthase